jgi:alpha-L-fucosidase 2
MAAGQSYAPPVRIACIGASITYGATLANPERDAYPQQLGKLLGARYQVTNYGVSGATLLRMGNLSYRSTTAYQAALQSNPDIVFIDLGGNDAKLINRVHIAEFENDYRDLIQSFEELPACPRIILLLPLPGFTKDTAQIWDRAIVSTIIPHIRQVAYHEHLELLDMHSLFAGKEDWMPDKIHPNLEGATLIARTLYSSLTRPAERAGISDSYPADISDWQNAFLAGNGKMGIMVFGNPLHETVIYNDRRFNLAKARDRSFARVSPADIAKIRYLCAEGHFAEANKLAVSSAQYSGGGEGNRHPGFEMRIDLPSGGEINRYSRICNFRTGEIIIKWADDRGEWERRAFVSRKDNVIVQNLTGPDKGKISCDIQLSVDPKMSFPPGMRFIDVSDTDHLNLRVRYPPNTNGAGYEGVTRVIVSGGSKTMAGDILHVYGADSVLLLTRTEKYYSDCDSQWNRGDVQKQLQRISANYDELLKGQIATHGQIYDRVKLDLKATAADRRRTNENLLKMQQDSPVGVKALWERVFDAGRYYFLSSGSELTPPDLLGIWTGDCNAGWGGFYHLDANLNLQVAGGNIGDMPEVMEGYFKINEGWSADLQINASKLLGCRGMVAAGNTPGTTTGLMAGISDYYPYQYATGEEDWLLYPFWEHYLVTGDKNFLKKRLYPMLKQMGYFYEDFLKLKDRHGDYIFAGSVSPENQPENIHVSLLNNSVFDISGAKFALTKLVEACDLLGTDRGKGQGRERWSRILKKLPPYLINADGALQEWAWPGLKDHYDHRHSSQLLPVWPYREITPEGKPSLFKAAAVTLGRKDAYNYGNTGHGLLHSALIAAGLKNAGAVNSKLLRLTKEGFYFNNLASSHNSGHAVFCTDACNTVPAIMMEMLVSSDPGVLELLPALPEPMDKGEISGVMGRNRVRIERLSWNIPGHGIQCVLRSDIDQHLTLIVRKGIREIRTGVKVSPSALGEIARIIDLRAGVPASISIGLK